MPGRDTVVDVQSKVYLRDKVGKLGVAPLTSMFLFGPHQPSPTTNYRPALHDSTGCPFLPVTVSGSGVRSITRNTWPSAATQWKTRRGLACCSAAVSSRVLKTSTTATICAQARGLRRKVIGARKIELVEIPTNDETNDNIVTYWTPDQLPEPGKEMNFKYTITFSRDEDKLHAPDNATLCRPAVLPATSSNRI